MQNLWDKTKAILRGKFNDTNLLEGIRKMSNNLTFYLKQLEKEQAKSKVSRRKNTTKIKAEIQAKKTTEKINETKSWFFENINKINKTFTVLIKKKRRGPKIIK